MEAAKELNISTRGFCLKGFLTEYGADLSLRDFGLIEMDSKDYRKRTIKNIETSDRIVIFYTTGKRGNILNGGSKLTFSTSVKLKKTVIVNPTIEELLNWISNNRILILNVEVIGKE